MNLDSNAQVESGLNAKAQRRKDAKEPRHLLRSVLLVCVFWFLISLVVYAMLVGGFDFWKVLTWSKTTGRVLEYRTESERELTASNRRRRMGTRTWRQLILNCEYQVDAKLYVAENLRCGRSTTLHQEFETLNQPPTGKLIVLHYDKRNLSEPRIFSQSRGSAPLFWTIAIAVLLGILAALRAEDRKSRSGALDG